MGQQSNLKGFRILTSPKLRPEVLQLVQITVVVQTLNHNTVKQWVVQKTALTTLGRTPQRRQVFIFSLILSSGKGRDQSQLQTWLN